MKPDDAILYFEVCDLVEFGMPFENAIHKVANDYDIDPSVVKEAHDRLD